MSVLGDCSGDSVILANTAGQNVLVPTESTGQTLLTPIASTASTAVDTRKGSIFEVRAVDNNDELRLIETDFKSGWNTRFKSGMCRGIPFGVVLRDFAQQVVSLFKAESVPANMREFLSWTKIHYRIDATTSTLQCKTDEPTLVVPCPSGRKEFSRKGSKEHFVRSTCKIRGTVRKKRRTPRLDSTARSQRHTDHRESSLHTKGIHRADRGTHIDSALREIYDAHKAARSASSNRDGGLGDNVLKDTAITKRQPDLATRMVLEQDSLFSNWDFSQPTILQLPLDFVDRAAESITAFVSARERQLRLRRGEGWLVRSSRKQRSGWCHQTIHSTSGPRDGYRR